MKQTLSELFTRFVASVQSAPDSCLHINSVQPSAETAKIPIHTVTIDGLLDEHSTSLALIAMTVPSLATDDAVLLEFAIRRARAYKIDYFVTWTLRDAVLWRTPKPGLPSTRDSIDKLHDYPDIYEIGASDDQPLAEPTKLKVLGRGQEIISDLIRLLKDETLGQVKIDATYFVRRLIDAVHKLLPSVQATILHRIETEVPFRKEITDWALKQGIAGSPADPEFAGSISRQVIYRLLGKMLFYQSLRKSVKQLPKLDMAGLDSAKILPQLRSLFQQALKIDYHAVFDEAEPDRISWPSDASLELSSLIEDFNKRDFASLPQDVVGAVFEQLIPAEERHGLGQYFTNEHLCDFINAFCIHTSTDSVLDPTCGTGTFLIRAYDRLRSQGQYDHTTLLSQLWGIDIAPFPAELATINLFRQRIAEHGNFPRIICKDFFKINPGDTFPFPPPKMDYENPQTIEEPVPLFDAVVGNFPYISASMIEKHETGYLEFLRKRLIEGWFHQYPDLFCYPNKKEQESFEKCIALANLKGCDPRQAQHRLSTYADLYVYLFFHAARFLKPGGRMGIITSNAWLDVNYGYALQEFFLRYFKVIAVLESRCEPWFIEASVNTIVTVIERCDDTTQRDEHLVKFIKVKKPLLDLMPHDPQIDTVLRWNNINNLCQKIENAGSKYLKKYPLGIVTEEDDDFRIRILRQSELLQEVQAEGKTIKWGKFLRAPEIYYDILKEKGENFTYLGELTRVKRGCRTSINDFFYLSKTKVKELGIEREYLFPLFKSPKDSDSISISPDESDIFVFICRDDKKTILKKGHKHTLEYISWGEQQVYLKGPYKGLKWPEGTEVSKRKPGWYALPLGQTEKAQMFFSQAFGERHIHRFSSSEVIPDKRLYFLKSIDNIKPELIAAVLNSSITSLFLECIGRVTLGDGALEMIVEDARDYLLIPDLRKVNATTRKAIIKAFETITSRPIGTVFNEIKQKDRQELDKLVLEAIGLNPKKYLKPLYEGLCMLVRERSDLGQMRGKARKTKARGEKVEKKVAEDVLNELLPTGPLRFPDEFFSTAAAKGSKQEIVLPDELLIFEDTPLFKGVHGASGSFTLSVKTPQEGKFLIYAHKAGHRTIQMPEKMVEITRTVANYEKYLRELRGQLYEAYYHRTLDTKISAKLTQSALDRLGLPSVEGDR